MSRLLEDHGKELLDQAGITVPDRAVATSVSEARSAAEDLEVSVVVKSLVPVGKRMKAGAVKFASTPDAAGEVAGEILHMDVHGYPAERVLVEERIPVKHELFASFTVNVDTERPVAVLSTKGGIDVEEEESAETTSKTPIDSRTGLFEFQAREHWSELRLDRKELVEIADMTARLSRVFVENDLETVDQRDRVTADGSAVIRLPSNDT